MSLCPLGIRTKYCANEIADYDSVNGPSWHQGCQLSPEPGTKIVFLRY